MATWVRSFSSNLIGVSAEHLVGPADLDSDTAPSDFDPAAVNSVQFEFTLSHTGSFASGSGSDNYQLQNVEIQTSGSAQLAAIAASGTLDDGTATVVIDTTDNAPNNGASIADWEGARFESQATNIAVFDQVKGPDGVVPQILAASVTITIDYEPGAESHSGAGAITAIGSIGGVGKSRQEHQVLFNESSQPNTYPFMGETLPNGNRKSDYFPFSGVQPYDEGSAVKARVHAWIYDVGSGLGTGEFEVRIFDGQRTVWLDDDTGEPAPKVTLTATEAFYEVTIPQEWIDAMFGIGWDDSGTYFNLALENVTGVTVGAHLFRGHLQFTAPTEAASITETHTVVATGDKEGRGAGTSTNGHTVVATGIKNAFGAGSISHGHTVVGVGSKDGEDKSGSGSITETHTVIGTGDKEGLGAGSISHGHTVVGVGNKDVPAAPVIASLTSGDSTTDATSIDTASVTPTGNALILAVIASDFGGRGNVPTASGNGLTWEIVRTVAYGANGTLTLFRAMGVSPSSGAITFDFDGQSQTDFAWSVAEYTGVITGNNGADAIRQLSVDTGGSWEQSGGTTLRQVADEGNPDGGPLVVGAWVGQVAGTSPENILASNPDGDSQGIAALIAVKADTTIALVGVDTKHEPISSTTITFDRPAGVVSGDAMYAWVSHETGGTIVWTPPSGWSQIGTNIGNLTGQAALFEKIAGGSEPSTYDFDVDVGNEITGTLIALTGTDATTPTEDTDLTGDSDGEVDLTVTPSSVDDWLVMFAGNEQSGHAVYDTLVPTLADFFDSNSVTYAVAVKTDGADAEMTGDGNMTTLHDVFSAGFDRLFVQYREDEELTADWTWTTQRATVAFNLEILSASSDRSGSGAITNGHTVIGVGTSARSGTGAVTNGHTVIATGFKDNDVSGAGSITHGHTVVGTGFKTEGASLPFTDDWTGDNDDPWNSDKWPTITWEGTVDEIADIQSNEGRMKVGVALDDYVSANADSITDIQDAEVLLHVDPSNAVESDNQYFYVCLRSTGEQQSGGAGGRPETAYYLRLECGDNNANESGANRVYARKANSEGSNILEITSADRVAGEPFWIRFQVIDNGSDVDVKVKIWDDSGGEPGAWSGEVTDTSPGILHGASGILQLVSRDRTNSASMDVRLDDIWYNNAGAPELEGSGAITETHSVVGTGTSARLGSGTSTDAHTVVGSGDKGGLGAGSISHGHSVTAAGFPLEHRAGSGAIGQGHTVTADGIRASEGSGAVSNGHTVVATGDKEGLGSGAISQGHSVVASGFPLEHKQGSGSISQGHTVIATGVANELHSGAGAITETHSVTATGDKEGQGTGSISHGHTVVATGDALEFHEGAGSIPETHSVVATGDKQGLGAGTSSDTHTVVASGSSARSGTGAVTNGHTVEGTGFKTTFEDRSGFGAIVETHTVVGDGDKQGLGAGAITPVASVDATGSKAVPGAGSISQGHTVVATGFQTEIHAGSGSIVETHSVNATGDKEGIGNGAISQGHSVVAAGDKEGIGEGSITQGQSVVGQGDKGGLGSGNISQGHTVVATGVAFIGEAHDGAGTIVETHTVVATGFRTSFSGSGSITETHTVVAAGFKGGQGTTTIASGHSVVALGFKQTFGTGTIVMTVDLDAFGVPILIVPGTPGGSALPDKTRGRASSRAITGKASSGIGAGTVKSGSTTGSVN
jgi:hypothetical protein